MPESRAVSLALAHLEAWTNHDLDTVRGNLAEDVQFYSPAANLVGIDEYMDAPKGLTQFARHVVPGSLRVIAATGDERNALIRYEVSTDGGPLGSKVFPSAQTWLLDDSGKIKVERIVSYIEFTTVPTRGVVNRLPSRDCSWTRALGATAARIRGVWLWVKGATPGIRAASSSGKGDGACEAPWPRSGGCARG